MTSHSLIKRQDNVDSGAFTFANEPKAGADETLVYFNSKGESEIVLSGHQMSRKIKKANRYHVVYAVSNEMYYYEHTREYESKDIGQNFIANVMLKLSIVDPVLYITKKEYDVVQLLEPKFKNALWTYAKNYSILDYNSAIHEFDQALSRMGIQEELMEYGITSKLAEATFDLTRNSKIFYDQMFQLDQEGVLNKKRDEKEAEREHERATRTAQYAQERARTNVTQFMENISKVGYIEAAAILQAVDPELFRLMNATLEREHDQSVRLAKDLGISIQEAEKVVRERRLAAGPEREESRRDSIEQQPKTTLSGFFGSGSEEP